MRTGARKRTSERLRGEAGILSSDSGLTAGEVIAGRFRLVAPLDGKQRVWRASDEAGRSVVLKTGTGAQIEQQFRLLSDCSHRTIVASFGSIDCESGSFLILEDLAGGDLVSLAGLSPRFWLRPVADVIDALGYLHRRGVVHRDFKARNVLFDTSNQVRLIDFESALPIGSRWTAGGTTESLIRPNRHNEQPVSAADDVYALTRLLHEMLYGMPPGAAAPGAAAPEAAAASSARQASARWAEPLADLVAAGLEAPEPGSTPGLERFESVVELLMAPRPDIQ